MLQLAYCIRRPVLGHEEVGATDARRIGRPVQQSNMQHGPPKRYLFYRSAIQRPHTSALALLRMLYNDTVKPHARVLDILTQHTLAPPPTPTHTDERTCQSPASAAAGAALAPGLARLKHSSVTDDAHSLASRAGHRQQTEGGTEHGRVRDTGGHTATPTGVLIRPVPPAL
eukprot:scaffold3343_cov120-Isochrysis_galbana.AAC.2